MEEGIAHDNGIQKRVQLLNAATERHRLEGYYRLGQVPAHILHPLVRGLTRPSRLEGYDSLSSDGDSSLMEVDEEEVDVPDPQTGLVIEMGGRSKTTLIPYPARTQGRTMLKYDIREKFTEEEKLVNKRGAKGVENRAKYPEAVRSRNALIAERNVKTRKDWKATDAEALMRGRRRRARE